MSELSSHAPWIVWSVLAFCVILVGVAKSGLGGGIGVLATALMSLVVSPLVAVGLLLPLLIACDVVAVWHYRRTFDRQCLGHLLPGGFIGVGLGALCLWLFQEESERTEFWLRMIIGAVSMLFVAWQLGREWLAAHLHPAPPRPWLGNLFGMIAGFVSMLAHAGGPPVTMYLLPIRLERLRFAGTTVWFFAALNLIKLGPYAWLGLLPSTNLKLSLMLLPLVPVGVGLGIFLIRRMNQRVFERVIVILLAVTGLELLGVLDYIFSQFKDIL